jgi:hypothetical protein
MTNKMVYIIRKIILCIFLFAALSAGSEVYAEDTIQYFNEKLTISLFLNYNYGSFTHEDIEFITVTPINIGFGLRYKNLSASFSVPITFNNTSFDFVINPYFDKIYYYAYVKYYHDFYQTDLNEKSNLDILSSAITATYVMNHENHSLSSVINLDKKQTVSSGSLLYSFGAFFSSIFSETMYNYNGKRHNLIYFGPGMGYSYTFVFDNDMFINVSMVIFTNAGINMNNKEWLFIPQMEPQIVFGRHNKTWSFNIRIANNSEFILREQSNYNILTLSSFSAILSKRF